MKIPRIFVLDNKDLERKTKELLDDSKNNLVFNTSNRIHYCMVSRWYLEYDLPGHKGKWSLAEKEDVRWYDCLELTEKAKEIITQMIEPVADLLKLRDHEYSLETNNVRSLFDKYANKLKRRQKKLEDKNYGLGKATFYKRGKFIIELREFDEIDLGIVKAGEEIKIK